MRASYKEKNIIDIIESKSINFNGLFIVIYWLEYVSVIESADHKIMGMKSKALEFFAVVDFDVFDLKVIDDTAAVTIHAQNSFVTVSLPFNMERILSTIYNMKLITMIADVKWDDAEYVWGLFDIRFFQK